ncbi:MAG: FAD-dependent oxidoreductase [Neomegalonema sp.]|nr:FAD-dependent oxidoreductase [Neomegalonema sp.]
MTSVQDQNSASQADQAAVFRTDVAIIGGGPGGAACAIHLLRKGLKVLIIEKDRHPRFHVGESLLPESLPLLEELGLRESTKAMGVFKPGAEFIGECGIQRQTFNFDRALLGGPGYAYQVRRAEFDAMVFDRALEEGAQAWQDTLASVQSCDESGAVIEARGPDGETRRVEARFLVDASGRSTVMANRAKEKRKNPHNDSAAVFGHFTGVPRDSSPEDGNIRLYLIPDGWIWRIPLPDGSSSMGMVMSSEQIGQRGPSVEAFFRARASQNKAVAEVLEDAKVIGRMNATGNFSYRADTAGGPGHIKVGDAFGFIDPVFSTGVHLALGAAKDAAQVVELALESPSRYPRALRRYQANLCDQMDCAGWFIYRIRDEAFRELLLNPRDVLGMERAVISFLAGDLSPKWQIRARIRLFKAVWWIRNRTARRRSEHREITHGSDHGHGAAA